MPTQENTLVKAKTIVRAKGGVRPETTAAKARTLAKARAVARLQIAAVRARMDAKPAKAFSHIAIAFPIAISLRELVSNEQAAVRGN
jgi:hypothetical protein